MVKVDIQVTNIIFCFRFCSTRSIEDASVADRANALWESIAKLIKHWLGLCKSSRPKDNKSYETLVKYNRCNDPSKVAFFQACRFHFEGVSGVFSNRQTNANLFSNLT